MPAAPVTTAISFADKEQVPARGHHAGGAGNADTSPTSYPYVTNRAPVTYEQAVKAWAAQRFNLTGGTPDVVRVTLRTGSIVEKLLPVHTGISGWFHKDQSAEYTGTLDILIEIVDANGQGGRHCRRQVVGKSDGARGRQQYRSRERLAVGGEDHLRQSRQGNDSADASILAELRTPLKRAAAP